MISFDLLFAAAEPLSLGFDCDGHRGYLLGQDDPGETAKKEGAWLRDDVCASAGAAVDTGTEADAFEEVSNVGLLQQTIGNL